MNTTIETRIGDNVISAQIIDGNWESGDLDFQSFLSGLRMPVSISNGNPELEMAERVVDLLGGKIIEEGDYQEGPIDNKETKVLGLLTIIKGGPGSGIRGHRTIRPKKPSKRRRKLTLAESQRLDQLQKEKAKREKVIDITSYPKDANDISHEQRMDQADLKDIKAQMKKNLAEIQKGKPDHQDTDGDLSVENSGTIRKNMNAELQSYSSYLAGDTALRTRDYIDQFHKSLYQGIQDGSLKGVNSKDLDALGLDSVRKLIHQEVESNRQAFTDHGIRHIEGDVSRAVKLAEAMNPKLTGKESLMINFALVNHDVGYTVPLIRAGGGRGVAITKDHPAFSEKIAQQQEGQWNRDKIFSKGEYNKITEAIKSHDSTDIKGGNFLTAIRVSDNLSLFNEEKLPSMFKYVSGGDGILVRMGVAAKKEDKKSFESLRDDLHAKIDKASLNENLKRDLKAATKEISYVTPKFTLGVLAGYVSDIKKTGDKVDVTIKHNAYDAKMQKIFDMGQKQTKKFLGDYGITDFSKTEYDIGGKISLKVEGYKRAGISGVLPKRIGLGMVVKHLQGTEQDHDQSSHGGDAGISGGETIIEASDKITSERILALDKATKDWQASVGHDSIGNKKSVQNLLYERLKDDEDFLDLAERAKWEDAYEGMREEYKESAIKDKVRYLVDAWAGTSGDTNPDSIAIQMAVEKEFGIRGTYVPHRDDGKEAREGFPFRAATELYDKHKKGLRAFVRAQYEETQQYLKDKEIKEMLLFRGVGKSAMKNLSKEQLERAVNDVDLRMMPISSFSVSPIAAGVFVKDNGAFLVGIVPAERIFSTPRTGVGCTNEGEVVVLGGRAKFTALSDKPGQPGLLAVDPMNGTETLIEGIKRVTGKKSLGLQNFKHFSKLRYN